MTESRPSFDLSPLASDYEIVGEVGGPGEARTFYGTRTGEESKRKDDQRGVLITVVTPPAGDEGNALSHLAADTKLLSQSTHRRLVPVLDGRWIGTDAFAVITQRLSDPSLAKMLATGETFTNPRIAAILREINGLLEWAREQKIVHRNITADRVYLEPRTDRVRVSFAVASIGRFHHSDADDDARTIARLAMAMLTGSDDPRTYEGESLGELRPDLPKRLGEATEALLDEKKPGTSADVAAYLALIGMADPLAAGESERDRIRAEILEEQRAEREKLANERTDFEAEMARERAAFAGEMERERERVAKQQAAVERAVAAERAELAIALADERAALVAKRAELEAAADAQRAEVERAAAADRQQIERLRAEIKRAGELEVEKKRETALEDIGDEESVLDSEEMRASRFAPPPMIPFAELQFDDDSPVMSDEKLDFTPAPEEVAVPEPEPEAGSGSGSGTSESEGAVAGPASSRRKVWMISGGVAAVAALAAALAMTMGRGPARPASPAATAGAGLVVKAPVTAHAAPVPSVPSVSPVAVAAPARLTDSAIAASARWLDSVKTQHPLASSASAGSAASAVARAARDTSVGRDTRAARDTSVRRDTRASLDSLFDFRGGAPRRDTGVRRDPVVRRDTVVRPDTARP